MICKIFHNFCLIRDNFLKLLIIFYIKTQIYKTKLLTKKKTLKKFLFIYMYKPYVIQFFLNKQ